jgi:hypothetical protein
MLTVVLAFSLMLSVPDKQAKHFESPLDTTSTLTLCKQAKKDARQQIGIPGFRFVLFAYDIDFEPPQSRVKNLSEVHKKAYCDCYRTEARKVLRTYRIGDSLLCCLGGSLAYIVYASRKTD